MKGDCGCVTWKEKPGLKASGVIPVYHILSGPDTLRPSVIAGLVQTMQIDLILILCLTDVEEKQKKWLNVFASVDRFRTKIIKI